MSRKKGSKNITHKIGNQRVTGYDRYKQLLEKKIARLEKYGLKPTRKTALSAFELETEILTRRKLKPSKDIISSIVNEQTQPFTEAQLMNISNNAIIDTPTGNTWNPELEKMLDTLGIKDKYDSILKLKNTSYRRLRIAQMMSEVYAEMKDYLKANPGESEALGGLIGEAFFGS